MIEMTEQEWLLGGGHDPERKVPDMKKYFFSYVWKKADSDSPLVGCATTDDGEHPIEKIKRWSDSKRRYVLLYWMEVAEDCPVIDTDIHW
jgi:hypothetical protein